MIFYTGITAFLFLLRFLLKYDHIARRQLYYIIFSFLFLFVTFRYQVGCDWETYYKIYLKFINIDWPDIIGGPGRGAISMGWLNLALDLDLHYVFMLLPFSIIFFIGVHSLARRQPDPLGFLILLFPILIINMPMSGVRQGAAIGLICLAFCAFIDRRPIIFTIWVFLATGIHNSAFIFLSFLPFATGRINNTRVFITVLFAVPCLILLLFSDTAQFAIKTYMDSGREAYGAIYRVSILALTALYFFLFIKKKWIKTFPNDFSIISLGSYLMIAIMLLVLLSSIVGDRFGYYLIPLQAMIFARLPYLPFKKHQSLHSAFPYIGLLLVFIVWTQTSWLFDHCYVPYNSWILGIPEGNIMRSTNMFYD